MATLSENQRDDLKNSEFAFPKQRKEPIKDEAHIRAAVSRFDQVEGVTNKDRDDAWARITAAAKKHNVELDETDWRDLFTRNGRSIPKE